MNCEICNTEEATEQLPNESGLYVCWSCKTIQRDNMEIYHAMGTTFVKSHPCKKSPNGLHQCDCPVGYEPPKCQYCGDVM